MKWIIAAGCLVVAMYASAWPIGYAFTETGAEGSESLETASVEVKVDIRDRIAVTRLDQVFTNLSDREVEGIFDFPLPEGAVITDLVQG